jgi:hypothetical protein
MVGAGGGVVHDAIESVRPSGLLSTVSAKRGWNGAPTARYHHPMAVERLVPRIKDVIPDRQDAQCGWCGTSVTMERIGEIVGTGGRKNDAYGRQTVVGLIPGKRQLLLCAFRSALTTRRAPPFVT